MNDLSGCYADASRCFLAAGQDRDEGFLVHAHDDDIIIGNQNALTQKITFPFMTSEDSRASSVLLYLRIFNGTCKLLVGSTDTEVFFSDSSYVYSLPSLNRTTRDQVSLACDPQQTLAPVFRTKQNGVYDLTLQCCPGTSGWDLSVSVFPITRMRTNTPES